MLKIAIVATTSLVVLTTSALPASADWKSEAKRCDPKTWITCQQWVRKCGGDVAACTRPGQYRLVCPSCSIRG